MMRLLHCLRVVAVCALLCGCAQARVYNRSFGDVLAHLEHKYETTLIAGASSTVYPVDDVPTLSELASTQENPLVARLAFQLLASEELQVVEYIPGNKLRFRTTNSSFGKTTKKVLVQSLPEDRSRVSVNFFSRFLIFFSLMKSGETEYLDSLERGLEEDKVVEQYTKLNMADFIPPFLEAVREIEPQDGGRDNTTSHSGGPN